VRLKPAALLAGQFVSEAVLRTDPGAWRSACTAVLARLQPCDAFTGWRDASI